MKYSSSISVILAVVFFILPLVYRLYYKRDVDLSDLVRITLSAMALPNLVICLFYLLTNPPKAIEMGEAPQYLVIAVLVITYLSIREIKQIFEEENDTS